MASFPGSALPTSRILVLVQQQEPQARCDNWEHLRTFQNTSFDLQHLAISFLQAHVILVLIGAFWQGDLVEKVVRHPGFDGFFSLVGWPRE